MSVPLAAVQLDIRLGDPAQNRRQMAVHLTRTAREGAQLVIFPECALTGYCFDTLDEARPWAESIPGPSSEFFTEICRQEKTFVVYGLLEADRDRLFNACVLIGPQGVVGSYRKIHLPFLGIDRFVTPGDRPFRVHPAGDLRIGMHICYDGAFPEAARVMALAGADLLVLPTNFPPGAQCMARFMVNTRAMENQVYFAAVNRVGTERGFRFIGNSRICNPSGETVAQADGQEEAVLQVDVDPAWARNKHIVRVPGKHEIHRFRDRRPEMYGPLTEKGPT